MTIKTDIGYCNKDDIYVRGYNLADELIGQVDVTDMMLLSIFGKKPNENLKKMVSTLIVATMDHGLTPSALAARLTLLGAPEALQGAVAAGLLGAGDHFLGTMQNVAQVLQDNIGDLQADQTDLIEAKALALVKDFRQRRAIIPGIGHPIHIDGDPRVPKLLGVAEELGFRGRHWELQLAIHQSAEQQVGKKLPMNAAGAVGATVSDMGFKPVVAKAFALIGRCSGLVAHLIEEQETPIGQELWDLVLDAEQKPI